MTIPDTFSYTINKNNILLESSSGGAFFAIAKTFFEMYNGTIFAVKTNNGIPCYDSFTDISQINPFLGSKYVFCSGSSIFESILSLIVKGKKVLFVGNPCQISLLTNYFKKKNIDYEHNLFLVDFICHGSPKQIFWTKYLQEIHHLSQDKVLFRYKKNESWEKFNIKIGSYERIYSKDPYMNLFLKNYTLLDTCYHCAFKGENRDSDCTIGDFWGCAKLYPNYYNSKGTSVIIIRKNKDFYKRALSLNGILNKVMYSLALSSNTAYFESAKKPNNYSEFIENSNHYSIQKLAKLYVQKPSLKIRILNRIERMLYKKEQNKTKNDIGIITCYGYSNFGNRLQNFALQTFLKMYGYNPRNIAYDNKCSYHFYSLIKLFRLIKHKPINRVKYIKKVSKKYEGKTIFVPSYLPHNFLTGFRKIIVGGDQVWNTKYRQSFIDNLLLCDKKKYNTKICSFAASLGSSIVTTADTLLFLDAFSNVFDRIGFREKTTQDFFAKHGVKCYTNSDPVLLLSKEEWNTSISKYSNFHPMPKKYVLLYFLSKKEDCYLDAKKKALSMGCQIIDLSIACSSELHCNQFDFIKLIRDCDQLFTDSFHGVVFASIFGKKTSVYSRSDHPEMDARIDDFLKNNMVYKKNGVVLSLDKDSSLIDESKEYLLNFLKL